MTDTIFFDVGNTLRIVIPDKAFSDAAEKELMELVGATEPHDVFFEKLEKRWKKYRSEVKKTLIDAGEMELWSQHLLPDYDPERVCAHAGRLTRLWRDHDGRRVARPDVKDTILKSMYEYSSAMLSCLVRADDLYATEQKSGAVNELLTLPMIQERFRLFNEAKGYLASLSQKATELYIVKPVKHRYRGTKKLLGILMNTEYSLIKGCCDKERERIKKYAKANRQ